MMQHIRRLLIGRPLHNQEIIHEKLPKWKALSIFSSDPLSSVGYGPEQIVIVLTMSGLLAYGYYPYIFATILAILAIISISYGQVAKANPGGGGSYSVAMRNLGVTPALIAAASLFADYVLTVSVSVSSGTDALVSAFPVLIPHTITIDLLVLFGLLMIVNLRGIRESSNVFVFPTYAFVFGIFTLIAVGVYQVFTQTAPFIPAASVARHPLDWTMLLLVLRAFSSGCASVTGVEAISNGVPAFRKPEAKNAALTTYYMAIILGIMLIGISFLIMHYHFLPLEKETMLSQLAAVVFKRNWFYYFIQISTMLVLYIAANTSYNGLPPLLSIMAKDGYAPRYLGLRGERLSFSNGIVLLSIIAGILILIFHGNVEHLLSLYALGVYTAFTISQMGMVVHWRREKGPRWVLRAVINAIGACLTGSVVIIVSIAKFSHGAWIVLVFVPIMICIFRAIRAHYNDMAEQLHLPEAIFSQSLTQTKAKNLVVVPIASPTRVVAETLRYARSISEDIIVLHIATDEAAGKKVEDKWKSWNPGIELVTVYSPYRLVIQPILDFVSKLATQKNDYDYITVVIPEFETKKWWHRLLHNQTGWVLRTLLIFRENVIVTAIPYHLKK
ncbi:amino acid/polyamine transporter i [Lucifera butyrica]|uniref:Amino acid/polyamine transporter i n=1 Tax=Lucifera butyrica TaxID=1351585 RepID=A0A498R734_9FIRM|nr:APC family permease [Lucifera butyrica]VBB07314.1 amino acid/polyamine transporter i [Lucifera butyrica]